METTQLELWLQAATRSLSCESAAQVRREIREHWELAREAAIERGDGLEEAERAVAASLGDPRAANRRYRRVLLTATEAKMLRDAQWEGRVVCARRWLVWLLRGIPVTAGCAAAVAFLYGYGSLGRWLLWISVISAFWIAGRLCRSIRRRERASIAG
jgi:hypothetical protein